MRSSMTDSASNVKDGGWKTDDSRRRGGDDGWESSREVKTQEE